MTKDGPRNRLGKGGKSGGFRPGGPRPGGGAGARPEHRRDRKPDDRKDADGAGDKSRSERPWERGDRNAHRKPDHPRREDRSGHRPRPPAQFERRDAAFEENGEVWIWGLHAAGAVIANPMRKISKAFVSPNAAVRAGLNPEALPKFAELMEPKEIDLRMPPGAVHQGLAVRCRPLDGPDISDVALMPEKPLVILDQVTDPQNVGAIFRSAAAFGFGGVVMQTRNAPVLGGALAKAATGALEHVHEIRVVNVSRAIDVLRDAGWTVVGLDGAAEMTLESALAGSHPVAIVMGAEGDGLRAGVAKSCSLLARIPMPGTMESLNVSNAAAIAFYEVTKQRL